MDEIDLRRDLDTAIDAIIEKRSQKERAKYQQRIHQLETENASLLTDKLDFQLHHKQCYGKRTTPVAAAAASSSVKTKSTDKKPTVKSKAQHRAKEKKPPLPVVTDQKPILIDFSSQSTEDFEERVPESPHIQYRDDPDQIPLKDLTSPITKGVTPPMPPKQLTRRQLAMLSPSKGGVPWVPDVPVDADFKYDEVIRNRDARKQMHAEDCPCCSAYFRMTKDLRPPDWQPPRRPVSKSTKGKEKMTSEDEKRQERLNFSSRHRALHRPNNTPEGFWDIAFTEKPLQGSPYYYNPPEKRAKSDDEI